MRCLTPTICRSWKLRRRQARLDHRQRGATTRRHRAGAVQVYAPAEFIRVRKARATRGTPGQDPPLPPNCRCNPTGSAGRQAASRRRAAARPRDGGALGLHAGHRAAGVQGAGAAGIGGQPLRAGHTRGHDASRPTAGPDAAAPRLSRSPGRGVPAGGAGGRPYPGRGRERVPRRTRSLARAVR